LIYLAANQIFNTLFHKTTFPQIWRRTNMNRYGWHNFDRFIYYLNINNIIL